MAQTIESMRFLQILQIYISSKDYKGIVKLSKTPGIIN